MQEMPGSAAAAEMRKQAELVPELVWPLTTSVNMRKTFLTAFSDNKVDAWSATQFVAQLDRILDDESRAQLYPDVTKHARSLLSTRAGGLATGDATAGGANDREMHGSSQGAGPAQSMRYLAWYLWSYVPHQDIPLDHDPSQRDMQWLQVGVAGGCSSGQLAWMSVLTLASRAGVL